MVMFIVTRWHFDLSLAGGWLYSQTFNVMLSVCEYMFSFYILLYRLSTVVEELWIFEVKSWCVLSDTSTHVYLASLEYIGANNLKL